MEHQFDKTFDEALDCIYQYQDKPISEDDIYDIALKQTKCLAEHSLKEDFDSFRSKALACLLLDDVVFLNSFWSKRYDLKAKDGKLATELKDIPEWNQEDSELIAIYVICNDIFAWGCADAQSLPYNKLEKLYEMWRKDKVWGTAVWCCIQRNEMPQRPVAEEIRKAGIWDLDALNLEENGYDKAWKERKEKKD